MPKWSICAIALAVVSTATISCQSVHRKTSPTAAPDSQSQGYLSRSEISPLSGLFANWERVWQEGQYDLIGECVAANYLLHDEAGDRTITREAYAAEIAKTRQDRPHLRFVVYDHSFEGNRAWFRFTLKWADAKTGETRTRAGMQIYRIDAGKLAETWLMLQPLGSAWPDTTAQEDWTSLPSGR
jgi:hypothetical protein